MNKKNYIIAKKNSNGEMTLINYTKDGYKITPKNSIKYPGIEVNEIFIIKPSFIEKIIKRKNKIKLENYLKYIEEEASDNDPASNRIALDNIERYKGVLEYKYRKYLDDKYINQIKRKLSVLEKKLKSKMLYSELIIKPEVREREGKSR